MTAALATAAAIGLALVGAVCFAFSAVHQHSAVADHRATTGPAGGSGERPTDRTIGLRSLRSLVRRPRWLLGMSLAGVGGLLAVVALSLAPLSVIQPIGVLSVPFALLIHAIHQHRRPRRVELVAVLAAVLGTAAFVWFVTGTARSRPPEASAILAAGLGIGALVAVLALLGRFGPYRGHPICWAMAGAGLYGLGTTMIKSMFLLSQAHPGVAVLEQPATWTAAVVAVISFPLGVWAVQHAYLAGSPQVVVAALTVIDPLVCVTLGFTLIGEGGASSVELVGMIASAAVALFAVVSLARSDTLRTASLAGPSTPATPAPRRIHDLLTMGRHS